MSVPSPEAIAQAATTIRVLTIDAIREARGSGHVGLPLGCAEIGVVLFGEFLKHDPHQPDWPDRDRFVLSGGHGSMLLYGLLHLADYDLPMDELRRFRQLGSSTPGHPEFGRTPGVATTTGPLGQGFGNAVGMALAERLLAARLGRELMDHRTYVIASDGDLMEGVASEAASVAGHLGLGRLIVLYDDNGITIDGPTTLTFTEDVPRRFEAYDWEVQRIDGHDPQAVREALSRANDAEDRPHLIVCKTHIGQGSPAVDTSPAHGALGDDAVEQTRQNLGWTRPPFDVPDEVRQLFRPNAERGAALRRSWEQSREKASSDGRVSELWRGMLERQLPSDLADLLPDFRGESPVATRKASHRILNALANDVPSLIGGSADLSGSNGTVLEGAAVVERGKFEGRNIHFGVREHAMAAVANGMALHGGLRPYVGTFLVFSDYMRPSIRLAALMGAPVTFVFSHDSIFVGEDGPTHQPVEHAAALRAIPNLAVWRPADARETVAAWRDALERDDGPVALLLTRQSVPVLEADGVETLAARGGYVVEPEPEGAQPELVIVGTGSETSLAVEASRALGAEGRSVRAVSLPCLEVFQAQDEAYQGSVLPPGVSASDRRGGCGAGPLAAVALGGPLLGYARLRSVGPLRGARRALRVHGREGHLARAGDVVRGVRALAGLALITLLGCGPIGLLAGGPLTGEVVLETVDDWSFTEDVGLVQVETRPGFPHSVTTICYGAGSDLYIPARDPIGKRWVRFAIENPNVRVRVDGKVYPRRAVRVTDPEELEGVLIGMATKYDFDLPDDRSPRSPASGSSAWKTPRSRTSDRDGLEQGEDRNLVQGVRVGLGRCGPPRWLVEARDCQAGAAQGLEPVGEAAMVVVVTAEGLDAPGGWFQVRGDHAGPTSGLGIPPVPMVEEDRVGDREDQPPPGHETATHLTEHVECRQVHQHHVGDGAIEACFGEREGPSQVDLLELEVGVLPPALGEQDFRSIDPHRLGTAPGEVGREPASAATQVQHA